MSAALIHRSNFVTNFSKDNNAVRVALYCSVSTQDQNCSVQLNELRDLCQRRNWTIVSEFVDNSVNSVSPHDPSWTNSCALAAEHRINTVCVYKLDRFGRLVLNFSLSFTVLDSYDVSFISR
jgi:DNA invertase Pin-like site-specific DNA recombinase